MRHLKWLVAGLAAVAGPLRVTPAAAQDLFQVTIDSTTIARAGATRLSDVLRLAGAWNGFSMDGFRWNLDPGVSASPLFPSWRIRVDGIPMSLGSPFDMHPELLPIVPGLVRQVRIGLGPGSVPAGAGAFAPGGRIDVETIPPPEGFAISGLVAAGNEVGDPGPYRYTPESAPNADRIGPVFGIRGSARADGWWLEGGFRSDEIHMTDPALEPRVRLLYRGVYRPRLLLAAPFLAVTKVGAASRHRMIASFSALRDLRFVPVVGSEVPILSRQWVFGAAGSQRLGRTTSVVYEVDARQQDMRPRTSDQAVAYDQVLSRLDAEVGLSTDVRGAPLTVAVGTRLHRLVDAAGVPGLTIPDITTPYGRFAFSFRPHRTWSHHLSAEARWSDEDPDRPARVRFSGSWAQRLGRETGSTLDAALSWIVEMPEAGQSPWFWMRQGWTGPTDPARGDSGRAGIPPFLMDSRTGAADLEWTVRRSDGATMAVAAFGRLFRGHNLPLWSMAADSREDPAAPSTENLHTGVGGIVYGARLRVVRPGSDGSFHRLDITWQRPVSGTDLTFWQHASTRPAVEAAWMFSAQPAPRTAILVLARFRTQTHWPAITAPFDPTATATLPARADLSLTLSKQFWGPRARAFATFEHLFDRPFRTHPLGQQDRLTLHIGLTARFGIVPRGT